MNVPSDEIWEGLFTFQNTVTSFKEHAFKQINVYEL